MLDPTLLRSRARCSWLLQTHTRNIAHGGSKLENVLYESEAATAVMKLIDSGSAKAWDPMTLMMASCGSIAYVWLDVLQSQGYTNICDL